MLKSCKLLYEKSHLKRLIKGESSGRSLNVIRTARGEARGFGVGGREWQVWRGGI